MRHQKSGRKFSRTSAHRDAMFGNMVASLLVHERIMTTLPKAKELRRVADSTIAWGTSVVDLTAKARDKRSDGEKAKIVHAVRMARRVVKSPEALEKLFGDVAARFKGRPGGFTRILKAHLRRGDAAPMAFVELTVLDLEPTQTSSVEAPAAAAEEAPKSAKAAKAPAAKAKAPKAEAADKAEPKAKKKSKKDE